MARTADPERRREVLDAVVAQLAETGISSFTLRGLAEALGQSTRVLTHHFADKGALLTAVLDRLDERQHDALRATEGWADPSVAVGSLVRSAWRRHLDPAELPMTRLVREIEGLAAAGRLPAPAPAFVRGRAGFVAGCLARRGVPEAEALVLATLLNAAYSGLQADRLGTGDGARCDAALDGLCDWIDRAVEQAARR
ncbi:TetR/AcrR family transcriptional regulator [Streptomyces sp. NPDC000594]|uniref:TetR/AcrR family transcriptional regulator n=1 Tax=Streptomyces sp. NPDC000594 TaxID=3154261 RepID=UPI003325E9BD